MALLGPSRVNSILGGSSDARAAKGSTDTALTARLWDCIRVERVILTGFLNVSLTNVTSQLDRGISSACRFCSDSATLPIMSDTEKLHGSLQ